MSVVNKILAHLGYEPALAARRAKKKERLCYSKQKRSTYWIANKLLAKSWARTCVRKAGLPFSLHPLADALEDDKNRERLIQTILEQKAIFASENKVFTPAVPTFQSIVRRQEERLEEERRLKAVRLQLKKQEQRQEEIINILRRNAKVCRKLHNKLLENYQSKVDIAKERKSEWLRPLMWEALANIQLNNNRLRDKKIFYKKAKDTTCFDCGTQESDPGLMTYDHLRDKNFNLGSVDLKHLNWRRLHQEIGKCDVVCRSCHDIREYMRGRWGWERLGSAEQEKISTMCYLERELYYQVITREEENPAPIDGESLRRVVEICQKILSSGQGYSGEVK